jgi:DNA-binding NarL/FixJ family response regulator
MEWLPARPSATMPESDPPALSPRELEVVRLLAGRMSTAAISRAMSISNNTVRTRARNALRKLGAENRSEVARAARDRGLV